ncbi:hypothetical protein PR202_gb04581 [Eleusine coracana subsp. coracana]|uniref:BSD domain-containing protein n=1 Tax=Eleusine coracana subsp. coracana TaxID=191504 RepID=A0AAV5E471_ELECO|nr:hypothetical protein PR202_gb04581 [Eleusine coracana subsp. coracana]
MATTLTPTQRYATGALLELTLRQAQIHQCAHLGGSEPDDEEHASSASSSASSDAASDTDLWMQDSRDLLRPVFRFATAVYVDMTDGRQDHALAVERVAPELADLRIELCPIHMSEGCFWMIYFVLMDPRLTKEDAEILSTLQVGLQMGDQVVGGSNHNLNVVSMDGLCMRKEGIITDLHILRLRSVATSTEEFEGIWRRVKQSHIKSYSHRYPTPYMASGSTAPYWFSIKRASAYIIIRASYDVDMTDGRQDHALAVERVAPELADLRIELYPIHMSEGCFWMIYFVLMDPRLTKEDAEILSTLQNQFFKVAHVMLMRT